MNNNPLIASKIHAIICLLMTGFGSFAPSSTAQQNPLPSAQFYVGHVKPGSIRYAAIGDSYTCGTGALPTQAWPEVLTNDLQKHGVKIGLALNSGVDGWTTEQALDIEMPAFKKAHPQFASLMIGVND